LKTLLLVVFFLVSFFVQSQVLSISRSVDWQLAGLRDTTSIGFQVIDMQLAGAIGDSVTPNDAVLSNVINSLSSGGAILEFPNGIFLFNNPILLSSNIILKGQGVNNTTLVMNLGGSGNSIEIVGNTNPMDTTSFSLSAIKDSSFIDVFNVSDFSVGDWIQLNQQDSDLVTSSWAIGSVGQIVQIKNIVGNRILLESPLRMDYSISRTPYIQKIVPVQNVGIECLKIMRLDDTAPIQRSNVKFNYAVNCWISGIESENCTFSHIEASKSSNITISKSYFHHAFNYGTGGRAYGVMLQSTSNECLVEDNIFEHLRHAMIVQSGANGNVFAYNYSFDPYWTSTPNDAAGDMVLHGNYPYANLFEQNVCRNIVIDNSHGPNGPFNTFFRNRAEGYGIFFSSNNSPNQNFIGNDISNNSFPYNLVNYSIQGTGHFIHGNNNKGTITPSGTQSLIDKSYTYSFIPSFVPVSDWAAIGTPNVMSANNIPAFTRYTSGQLFSTSCLNVITDIKDNFVFKTDVLLFPNPFSSRLTLYSLQGIEEVQVLNSLGQNIFYDNKVKGDYYVDTTNWQKGVYFVKISLINHTVVVKRVVKE